jgi:hypothetical protein
MSKIKIPASKNALTSFSEALESISNKVSQSIVSVHSENRENGSGVIWDSWSYSHL